VARTYYSTELTKHEVAERLGIGFHAVKHRLKRYHELVDRFEEVRE
jgi:predicted DNA-binding protein YlxM (UPF0122 family)